MTLLQELESRLAAALTATLGEPTTAAVTAAADLRFGDYQSNAAMVLAKQRKTNPRVLAQEIIDQLELSGRGSWRARLDSGAVIELGAGSLPEVQDRTQAFLKTLTQVSARYGRKPEALETADLRHQDGYALRMRGVTTLTQYGTKK